MLDNFSKWFAELQELINQYNQQRIIIQQLTKENAELKAKLPEEASERSRP